MTRSLRPILAAALLAVALRSQTQPDVSQLSWLAGHWAGSLNQAQLEEHWIAPKGGAMYGVSRTIVRDRVSEFEFLRIEQRGAEIFYVAQPGGRPPTDFKLTKLESGLAVFENPSHDFPKVITYRLVEPNKLVAAIEGEVKGKPRKIEFRMERATQAAK